MNRIYDLNLIIYIRDIIRRENTTTYTRASNIYTRHDNPINDESCYNLGYKITKVNNNSSYPRRENT